MSQSRVDKEFAKFRENLRGSTVVRVVDSANYYSLLQLVMSQIYTSNQLATRTIRFYDLVAGHFYQILSEETSERIISVKRTDEGWIINPSDALPDEASFLLLEDESFLLLEDESKILI